MERLPNLEIHIRSPEISLKGRNKRDFWHRLKSNVQLVLGARGLDWPVKVSKGRLFVEVDDYTEAVLEQAVGALKDVSGVTAVAVAIGRTREALERGGELDREQYEEILLHLACQSYAPDASFAIRARRIDKSFPMPTAALETWLGQVIRERTDWDRVQLTEPDQTFYIDIYADSVFFYASRAKGIGGLPVGSSGHVLGLLSGGIDSPAATFLMARRGCTVDWLHMSAVPVTEAGFVDSLPDRLAQQLSRYTLRSRLFVVPYTHFDLALKGKTTGYEPMLFRRFLFRVGEALAARTSAVSLVTGDSLSQVASQTIENLITVDKAVDIPVLRPLIGMDKQEIMDLAARIGTYEMSIEPYKDCCALYTRRVRTRTRDHVLSSMEESDFPSAASLVEASLSDALWARYRCGERVSVESDVSRLSRDRDAS